MAMGKGAFDNEELIAVSPRDILEDETKLFALVLRPVGKCVDNVLTNGIAFTQTFPMEDGGPESAELPVSPPVSPSVLDSHPSWIYRRNRVSVRSQ